MKIVSSLASSLLWQAQKAVLNICTCFFAIRGKKKPATGWVVGVEEIAGLLANISMALDDSVSVACRKHPFYDYSYRYTLYAKNKLAERFKRLFYSPCLFAYLASTRSNFFYISVKGFLEYAKDNRSYEFSYLKKRGKKICCYYTGSDIRSIRKSLELGERLHRDMSVLYLIEQYPVFKSTEFENSLADICRVTEQYASIIINAEIDQLSYFSRRTLPPLYFYDNLKFRHNVEKFNNCTRPIVVHAPSSPFVKGTPLVRAAIRLLEEEGYEFEYLELIRVPNSVVLETLEKAHIVLNEFYALMPGVFGVEAMAHTCCLLTSSDPSIELSLPPEASSAWIVTPYWNIVKNLRMVLDNPALMRDQAVRGYDWARQNYSYSASKQQFMNYIKGE